MHYFQFEIKEWISNTAHLTLEEEAVYLRLINYYYDSEKPLPLDSKDLGIILRKLRLADKKDTVGQIIDEFFTVSDTGFIHNRCELEIAKYREKSNKARTSASMRWKNNANPKQTQSNTTDMRPHTERYANQESLIINQESLIINKEPRKTIPIPDGMDVSVWEDYLKIRKASKKPLTETALKGLAREAEKAKISLKEAIQICCERGWIGFKADWVESKKTTNLSSQEWRNNDGLMLAKANELGLYTVGLQRYEIINKIDAILRSRGL